MNSDQRKIRIILADDHKLFREGLRLLIHAESDMEVVGEASTGTEVVALARRTEADVILMDITMPEQSGLQAARTIRQESPGVRILILSMLGDEESLEQAVQVGVDGYLVKETAASEFLTAIREVRNGNAFFSPSVSKILLSWKRLPTQRTSQQELTFREKEVLQYVAASKTNREISALLNISMKTVDKHRQQIMAKLNIHDIAGLTRYALQKGLVK